MEVNPQRRPSRPTADERTYGAHDGEYAAAPENMLAQPDIANYGATIVKRGAAILGGAALVVGIGMGMHESHIVGRDRIVADETYRAGNKERSIELVRESHEHAAAADNWRIAGWVGGPATIILGAVVGGRLRKRENVENTRRRAEHSARVRKHAQENRGTQG